jgi:hypothetical protein
MTFVVNHDGVVYEKDLGPGTDKVAKEMKTFNPDESWTRVASDTAQEEPKQQTAQPSNGG